MVPENPEHLHLFFLGVGGIGMSALARYYNLKGYHISGYDRTCTELTLALEREGVDVFYTDDPSHLTSAPDYVIYTPAIKEGMLLQHFRQNKTPMYKRAEVLGNIARSKFTIAVAGTHGKTTISSMIAHLLWASGRQCTAFLGGISNNLGSNFCFSSVAPFLVVEADEFDRSFHTLQPQIAVISSMDPDHLDIYGDAANMQEAFVQFGRLVKPQGTLICKSGLPQWETLSKQVRYASLDAADYCTHIVEINGLETRFNLVANQIRYEDLILNYPGWHNLENMTAAIAACSEAGIPVEELREGIASYSGVHRRFEVIINSSKLVFIDDYAHHPEELRAIITAARETFPGKRITGIFQPHLYSRTRDFADEFAASLSLLDELYLLDIYPAREKPIEGVSSTLILDAVLIKNKKLVTKDTLKGDDFFKDKNLQVLLTLGAGDISDLARPLKDNLLKLIF